MLDAKGRRGERPFCVCIPARNEAARLPVLISALARQVGVGRVTIVLCVNNSTDNSADVATAVAQNHPDTLRLILDRIDFPSEQAHAGAARRRAMETGLAFLGSGPDGVLLTTDADARPPVDWLAANLAAIGAGIDVVGGRLQLDESEPLPTAIRDLRRLWDFYWASVREIEDAIDPRPWDPPPRHGDHTGASLAITAAAYRAAGGVPLLATGEDRALVTAAMAAGARVVHPPAVWTRVSPRRDGRAAGGMAQDMAALFLQAESGQPILAPALAQWRERAEWRQRQRQCPDGDIRVARLEPDLPPMALDFDIRQLGREAEAAAA